MINNHAGARKVELNRAIQTGKGETTEGALLISQIFLL